MGWEWFSVITGATSVSWDRVTRLGGDLKWFDVCGGDCDNQDLFCKLLIGPRFICQVPIGNFLQLFVVELIPTTNTKIHQKIFLFNLIPHWFISDKFGIIVNIKFIVNLKITLTIILKFFLWSSLLYFNVTLQW